MSKPIDAINIDLLRNRAAILRDVVRGDEVVLSAGSLGIWTGRETGEAFDVLFDRASGIEHRVPASAYAHVDSNGMLPGPQRVSILFSAVVGSRAQGLGTADSDIDRRGFFIASPEIQFCLDGPPPQLVHDADQLCYWEIEKFLRLALKANPTVLETLYSPEVEVLGSAIADELSRLRQHGAFLSARAKLTFMGYADSQFEKMTRARERGGVFKWQHAMHLIRLLRVGARLMRTAELSVAVPPEERDELLAIKRGDRDWDDVCRLRESLVREFEDAAHDSPLPEEPDESAVNSFLVQLRIMSVEEACT